MRALVGQGKPFDTQPFVLSMSKDTAGMLRTGPATTMRAISFIWLGMTLPASNRTDVSEGERSIQGGGV